MRKKFEFNLNLKNNYDKNLIKLTNQNANINILVLLVECIYKFKLLNKISTLNLILKIVDKINLEFYQNKLSTQFPKSILKVITYEKKYLNFSIIVSNTSRSFEYLKQIKKNNLIPVNLVHLDNKKKL